MYVIYIIYSKGEARRCTPFVVCRLIQYLPDQTIEYSLLAIHSEYDVMPVVVALPEEPNVYRVSPINKFYDYATHKLKKYKHHVNGIYF